MAKSIRSKWRQKMRNEKRQKNYRKDVERLKKLDAAERASRKKEEKVTANTDVDGIASSTTIGSNVIEAFSTTENTPMMIDESPKKSHKYNERTMRDENGHYPVWLSRRRIKKMKTSGTRKKRLVRKRNK